MNRRLLGGLCGTYLWVTGNLIGCSVVLAPHEQMPPETNKNKTWVLLMCKVTDADCRNVDFVTSELGFLCLILHKSKEVAETIIVLVNTRTSPSNCAITNSCLLTHWCVMAPQTDWNGPYMSSTAYSPLQRAAGRVLGSGWGCGVCGVCSDDAKCCLTSTWRQRGTAAMMPVPSAGPVPGPPGPRRPNRRATPEPLGKYLSYCFHCQAISST